jgi:hypothetical protein
MNWEGIEHQYSEKSKETAEKVDIEPSRRADGRRIQLDCGAKGKPD